MDDAPTANECICWVEEETKDPNGPSPVVYSTVEDMCPKHGKSSKPLCDPDCLSCHGACCKWLGPDKICRYTRRPGTFVKPCKCLGLDGQHDTTCPNRYVSETGLGGELKQALDELKQALEEEQENPQPAKLACLCDVAGTQYYHCPTHKPETGGWCAPSPCATGVCNSYSIHDADCKGPGWAYNMSTYHLADGVLDLPSISVKRGGIRFWPMLPDANIRVITTGWGLWKKYHVLAFPPPVAPTYGSTGVPIGVFTTRWEAEMCKEGIEKYLRAVYEEIKKRVGDKW